jgi:hypothetical protein
LGYIIIPVELLSEAKRKYYCSISHFYGDALFLPYHFRTALVEDHLYFSNSTFVELAEKRGLRNCHYMPCPTSPQIFFPEDAQKEYDLIFIGNNNDPARLPTLMYLKDHYDFMIFGSNWESTGLPFQPAAYHQDFRRVIARGRVVLSLVGPKWLHLKRCFSNRLVNSLACRVAVVQTRTPEIETVFQHEKHLMLYSTKEEMDEAIHRLLEDENLRDRIATAGQEEVYSKYTYQKSVQRILENAQLSRELGKTSKYFPYPINSNSLLYSNEGIKVVGSESDQPVSDRIPGTCWYDGAGTLFSSPEQILIDVDAVPSDVLDRLDLWRECSRLTLPDRILKIVSNQPVPERWKQEMRMYGFSQTPNGKGLEFSRKPTPLSRMDQWFHQIRNRYQPRFGHHPIPYDTLEWCMNHPLTQLLLEMRVIQSRVLFLWSGLGEWTFVLQWLTGSFLVGMESSHYAVHYATQTYGNPELRFVLPVMELLPDQYFDTIIFITPTNRLSSISPTIRHWKRITTPAAQAFLGIFTLEQEMPPHLRNSTVFQKAFGSLSVKAFQEREDCVCGLIQIHDISN